MAVYLAVANRKGGVGKSTVSVMLAHAFSVWGGQRVLLLDIDSQCNASIILMGGENWQSARMAERTIADYIRDQCNGSHIPVPAFIRRNVGDVAGPKGALPQLSLVPGSIMLDDVQGDLFLAEAGNGSVAESLVFRLRDRMSRLLRSFEKDFDVVILDCAPGLSMATVAALKTADRVIVPFRPDYVSQMAVDRVALLIEEKSNLDELASIPFNRRRYMCLANFLGSAGKQRLILQEIALIHPLMKSSLAQRDSLAAAFDWVGQLQPFEEKYGSAIPDVRAVYSEVAHFIR